jgi:uncharacterized damage-inducible protein DinB
MGTIQAFADALKGYKDIHFLLRDLEETRDSFLKAIRGLSEEQWKFKVAPDCWSIAECAEHVTLSEESIRNRVKEAMRTAEATPAEREKANLTDEQWIERVADRSQRRASAPSLDPSGRWSNAADIEKAFRNARDVTVAYVKSLSEPELRKHLKESPSGTMLDAFQWLLLLTTHTRRHTLQIAEVKADRDYPTN